MTNLGAKGTTVDAANFTKSEPPVTGCTLFLFALNRILPRDVIRTKRLCALGHTIVTVSNAKDDAGPSHCQGNFNSLRFWKYFLMRNDIKGSSIVLDYFWLQGGISNYFISSYGGDLWFRPNGFLERFLRSGGRAVYLPDDSNQYVKQSLRRHKSNCMYSFCVIKPESNLFVQAGHEYNDQQSRYTHGRNMNYFKIVLASNQHFSFLGDNTAP